MQVNAMIHSLGDLAPVTIVSHVDDNNVVANYNGTICTAIFNVFVNLYYVDDIYGVIGLEE